MRIKFNPQMSLTLGAPHLKVTRAYYGKRPSISMN